MYSDTSSQLSGLSCCMHGIGDELIIHLIGVGACDPDGIEKIFKAMRNRPQVECHLVCHQSVRVVKQVDVAPSQRTVLLKEKEKRKKRGVRRERFG